MKDTTNRVCAYRNCKNKGVSRGTKYKGKRRRFCAKHTKIGPKEFPSDWRQKYEDTSKRICIVDGCNWLGSSRRRSDGSIARSKTCLRHKIDGTPRYVLVGRKVGTRSKKRLREYLEKKFNSKCQLCGWNGPCDLHRKVSGCEGGKYTRENTMLICPNCHRLKHYK